MLFDLDNVQKFYGQFQALSGITLKIESTSVGLLGPNGAGKSTLIKALLGLLEISSGNAQVLGYRLPDEAAKIRRATGYMPENDCFLPYMTAVQYVAFSGQLSGMPRREAFRRAHEVLYYVGLGEARYRKLSGFSTGMKQRVKLAQALVHGPKLVFLDEPTNGLDPRGRDEMLQLINDVKARGVYIVLSSHVLPDVETVCDTVIMLNGGQLVHVGPIDELKAGGERVIEVQTRDANARFKGLLEALGFRVNEDGLRLKVYLQEDQSDQSVLKCAVDAGIQLRHFMPGELTLETAFLGMIGRHNAASAPEALAAP
ncbi:MAG: ABC transporter ATP-binding protein [Bradymonadaceae bacterium]|nr:ABC transporter ATP-binding protein [Lujinxingiaceae bacterium]